LYIWSFGIFDGHFWYIFYVLVSGNPDFSAIITSVISVEIISRSVSQSQIDRCKNFYKNFYKMEKIFVR
jgi:hypothetical protein